MVAAYSGDYAGAERYATEAFERMRAGHQRLQVLAHDVAVLWMERGNFGRSLQVFDAVLPLIRTLDERLLVCCNVARCAGAEGLAEVYSRATAEAWDLIGDQVLESIPAVVFTNLARGAAGLRLWEDAERAAVLAGEAAVVRQEADQLAAVHPLLDSIRLHRFADALPETKSALEERRSRSLAAGLVEALTALRAGE
jgi:hypothetical protein